MEFGVKKDSLCHKKHFQLFIQYDQQAAVSFRFFVYLTKRSGGGLQIKPYWLKEDKNDFSFSLFRMAS